MSLATLRQFYLLPLASEHLNRANATLDALALKHELLPEAGSSIGHLVRIAVEVPYTPVVHHYPLASLLNELYGQAFDRTHRPSHSDARGWAHGDTLKELYPRSFFDSEQDAEAARALTEVVAREHILRDFAAQKRLVQKITFNKSIADILAAGRIMPFLELYALVEEARLLIPDLPGLLGAYSETTAPPA